MPSPRARFVTTLIAIGCASACGSAKQATQAPQPSREALAPGEPALPPLSSASAPPAPDAPTQTRNPSDQSAILSEEELSRAAPGDDGPEKFPSGLVVDPRQIGGRGPGPELPKGTRVLHVGDSFAGALGIELNKVFAAAGVVGRLEFEKSTYIPTWAHSAKLSGLLTSFKPDLVIISLGANELENPEPEKRAPLIQKIVNSLGSRACVWVAPVLWEGAKSSLLDVIRANVGHCVYLDSNAVVTKMPRAADKIHPAMAARPDWALVTARWLAYHRKLTEALPWAFKTVSE
jgi:hypothetical protein